MDAQGIWRNMIGDQILGRVILKIILLQIFRTCILWLQTSIIQFLAPLSKVC